ncbi:hypothetical protein LOOC260_113070 [Paucilactobacillus hokkaidonensis JCM 18461]|uniref:Uncharacterized protein n=2 Tax=Paucilactobacillus hokkaidonensis TaxID=1193095 RepID=A0A0A1GY30_9LACO|nr:hypothetical protein [Paucilactobacillus hokkaidonensis]BAP85843.1 hypothetical protein LOOC260_113070 [Paucilactobacillus hokkaidonensis JCM 18461]
MTPYKIFFNNRITTNSVVVSYNASTLSNEEIFNGRIKLQLSTANGRFLKSGNVALRAIETTMMGIDTNYRLVAVTFTKPSQATILSIPDYDSFNKYVFDHGMTHGVLMVMDKNKKRIGVKIIEV